MATKKKGLDIQIKDVLARADELPKEKRFFFDTSFERYQTQVKIMENLKKVVEDEGMVVEKEYVKGRKNIVTNPAIKEYNNTSTAANNTMTAIMKLFDKEAKTTKEDSKFMKFLKEDEEE